MCEIVTMPVRCNLPLLLAQANVERARRGQPRLSLRRLADESKVSLSVLAALNTDKSKRIDYDTIDKLLTFFRGYLPVKIEDLLVWEPGEKGDEASND